MELQLDAFFQMDHVLEQIRLLDRRYDMELGYRQRQIDNIRYHFNIYKASYKHERQALIAQKDQIIQEQETNEKKAQKSENREL